jgi:TonB family protein
MRRLKVRQTLGTLAYLDIGPDNGGIILNLSEDGLSFQAVAPLHGVKQMQLVIQLPQSDTRLEMASEIVWLAASAREGGVRFLNVSPEARAQIRHWIESQPSPGADSSRPDATAAEPRPNAREQQPLIPQRDAPGDSRRDKWLNLMQDFERDVLRQEPLQFDAVKMSPEGGFQPTNPALKLVPVPAPKPEIVPRPVARVSSPTAQTGLQDSTPAPPLSVKPSADSLGVGLPSFRRQALQNTSRAPSTTPPSFPPNQELPAEPDGDDGNALTPYVSPQRRVLDLKQGESEPAISKIPRDRVRNSVAVVVSFVLFCVLCFEIGTWVGNLRVRRAARLPAPTPSAANIAGQNAPPSGAPVVKVDPKSDVRVSIPRAVETRAHAKGFSNTTPHRAPAKEPAALFAQQRSVPPSSPTSAPALFTSSTTAQSAVNATAPAPSSADLLPENPAPRVIDGHVLQPSDRFNPCHLTYRVDPTYPLDAQRQGIQGTVKIHLVIAADGSVQGEQLISGPPQLVSAALDAAKYWRYFPALLNGQPISTQQDIEIAFQLHR